MKVLRFAPCCIFFLYICISFKVQLGNCTPRPQDTSGNYHEDDLQTWNITDNIGLEKGKGQTEDGIQEGLNGTTERFPPTRYSTDHSDSNSTLLLTAASVKVKFQVKTLKNDKLSSEIVSTLIPKANIRDERDIILETSTDTWNQNLTTMTYSGNESIYNNSDFGNGTTTDKSSIPYGKSYGFYTDIPNEVLLAMQIGKRYVIPICMICGTCFNFLSFVTMLHSNLRKKSYAVYLMALAVFDTLMMWWDGFASWLWLAFEVQVKDLSSTCWAKTFGNSFFTTTAAWLIVAVTFERFVVVYFPIKSRSWITTTRARIVTCVICLASAVIFSPLLFTYYSDNGASVYGNLAPSCKMRSELRFYLIKVVGICWTLFYCILPTASLILLNAAIIIKLKQSNRKYKTEMNETETSKSRQSATQHVSRMVTVISVTYIVFTFPVTVAFTYRQFNTETLSQSETYAWLFVEQIGQITAYLNHSINFFLYILSSRQFRSAFRDIISCKSRRNQLMNKRNTQRKTVSTDRSTLSSALSSKETSQGIAKPIDNAMVNVAFKGDDNNQTGNPA